MRRPPADLVVRDERPADFAAVHALHADAFDTSAEASLVDALRRETGPRLSLVAELGGYLVGHVFFSPVTIEPGNRVPAGGLAPVSVAAPERRRGIAESLIRHGLARCATLGWQAVFVVGDPAYYRRFGFRRCAPALRFHGPEFDEVIQVLELWPGVLDHIAGQVRYSRPFELVE